MCAEFEPPDRDLLGQKGVAIILCFPFSKALLQEEPELLGLALSPKQLPYCFPCSGVSKRNVV